MKEIIFRTKTVVLKDKVWLQTNNTFIYSLGSQLSNYHDK